MVENLYRIFIVCLILFASIVIITDQIRSRIRKNNVIIKLRKGVDFQLIMGLVWFILFLLYLYIFINRAQAVYYSLGKEYISNVFQLFDLEYLKTLRAYFFENIMLSELNQVAFYQSELLNMLAWIIGSFCISLLNFYKARQPDEILENGIVVSGRFIDYGRIAGYRRGNLYEKKWINKELKYYDYFFELKKKKSLSDSSKNIEVKIRVRYGDETFVDNNLDRFIICSRKGE